MKTGNVMLTGIALLFAAMAFAQETQRVEVSVDYSYLRFNPQIPELRSRSFNGGGGGVSFNVTKMFAIKAEFIGYGSTNFNATFTSPIATPKGTIPPRNLQLPGKHVHLSVRARGQVSRIERSRFWRNSLWRIQLEWVRELDPVNRYGWGNHWPESDPAPFYDGRRGRA